MGRRTKDVERQKRFLTKPLHKRLGGAALTVLLVLVLDFEGLVGRHCDEWGGNECLEFRA